MKGIAHFATGVAAASCFPAAVEAGAAGNPLYFIIGGVFGLLPDTLDFKFTRFFQQCDITVTPDPLRPDAQLIADAVALAIARAHANQAIVHLKLNTIQLAADRWQRYRVTLDVAQGVVRVAYGPEVDTGGNPLGAPPAESPSAVSAPLPCGIIPDYLATTDIDIFDGPVFGMEPTPDGRVRAVFIPWHRKWTHSLVLALLGGLAMAVIAGPLAGCVAAAAYAAHIAGDQLGFLGSNLWAPFSRQRSRGLKLTHSGAPLPNFLTVWLSVLLIFWNLAHDTTAGVAGLNPLRYLLVAAGLPIGLFAMLNRSAAIQGNEPGAQPAKRAPRARPTAPTTPT